MKDHHPLEPPHQAFYVFSGGPGSGKTTLLFELSKRGYKTISEVARTVIKEQIALGGTALPWENKEKYKMLMLERSVESYRKIVAEAKGPVFFDRGIPDTLAYSRLCDMNLTMPEQEAAAVYRYHDRIFLFPPWAEIYKKDPERKQDWEEAVKTHHVLRETYMDCGYQIQEVPRANVRGRACWLLDQLGLPENVQI